MSNTILAMGPAGSGKSTFALSSEGITAYMEFDPGSFNRAAKGRNIDMSRVVLTRHYPPLTALLDIGRVSVSNQGGIAPATVHVLQGWRETYESFVQAYLVALDDPNVTTIVIDTETRMWLTIRQAFLQQVQEAKGGEGERLSQLQYTEPNARHDQILVAAKMYDKNLVLISHLKEEYRGDKATGRMIHDGYKEAPNEADLTLEFAIEDKLPIAWVRKGSLPLLDMKLEQPTIPYVVDLLDAAAAIQRAGLEMPTAPDEVIALAKVLA